MEIAKWLEENAEQIPSNIQGSKNMIWVTKARGDYITIVGWEEKLPLSRFGITDHVSSTWDAGKPINIGFNPLEQKWYGWSHRAVYGFGVGAECKKGHVHYRPIDKDDFLSAMIRFWSDEYALNITGEHRENGVYVEWEYSQDVPNEKLRGTMSGQFQQYPDRYGRGEWKAKNLADARKMAIDFANNIA